MKRFALCLVLALSCSSAVQAVTIKTGGDLAADEVWMGDASPYFVTGSIIVADGCTLTIEPGVSVYLDSGVSIIVADGGRILAEGTETQGIHFSSPPDSNTRWGGITIEGSVGSPPTRMAYVSFEGNGRTCIQVSVGTLSLDHATFGTTKHRYLSLDRASFVISHCHFPAATASFEVLHGTAGIKAGGHGIVRHCFFGGALGYSDNLDFTGGNRELDQPILQIYNNVFAGSGDDLIDMDGTDAWIEGNIFLHCHRNGAPDSSAAISCGSSGGRTAEVTILGNLFFDCDNAVTAKQGAFFTLLNNTIVHTTKKGGVDFASGVVCVRDTTPSLSTFAKGVYLEGKAALLNKGSK